MMIKYYRQIGIDIVPAYKILDEKYPVLEDKYWLFGIENPISGGSLGDYIINMICRSILVENAVSKGYGEVVGCSYAGWLDVARQALCYMPSYGDYYSAERDNWDIMIVKSLLEAIRTLNDK